MKKVFLFLGLYCILSYTVHAQKIIPETVNVKQLASYEAAHPEMFTHCKTCARKERDGGWRILEADMPVPPDAKIKTQVISAQPLSKPAPGKPSTLNKPANPGTVLSPSPLPAQNFLGYVDPGTGIPPDTHGAIGPNHVVTATNDFLKIHSKNGAVISTVSISTFTNLPAACDPYIQYDPASDRFIYSVIDCNSDASGNPINGNRLVVLVSATNDPTGNWYRYTVVPGTGFFLDHPYLGFDDRWIVVSGRKFPAAGYDGPILILMDKATLLSNGVLNFGSNAQKIEKTTSDGDSPLPVTVFGSNPGPNTFYILQNWNGSNGLIRLSTVTGNIPNATWNTSSSSAVFPSAGSPWISQTGSVAEQIEETRKLATNDSRISTGVMVNGNIWCAHHVGISDNNVAVQWWQIDGNPGASFGNVLQHGRIGEGLTNNYRYFPAIAVNSNEDVIIGYTVSSKTSRVSAAYSFRSNATPPNTMQDENIYKVGLSKYYKDFGGSRARWGDYSHSAIDPVDGSLWTIQEYADQRIGTNDNDSRYGVWWAQVSPLSTLLQRDASIGSVAEPNEGIFCNVPTTPTVIVRNLGTDTLRSVQIGMMLDGVPVGSLNTFNNLSIPTFSSSAPLVLTPGFNPSPGGHTFEVYTINPNGGQDQRTNNDTTLVNFTVAETLTLPYTETFASNIFPPSNGTQILNQDDPQITWQRTSSDNGNRNNPDSFSIMMDCYEYGGATCDNCIGQRDIYRLPKINTGILDSLSITFKVAYQQYFGSDVSKAPDDSLRLIYSPDCGISWFPTDYYKGGASLSTVRGTTSAAFVPAASQWRTEKVVLKDFCSRNLKNVMLGFESVNDWGNNIYVDSIVVKGYNSYSVNATLKSISQPLSALCVNSYAPRITFGNSGLDTIRSLKINYQLDGGTLSTINWTGVLAKCDSVSIDLPQGNSSTGTHALTVFTSEPNGVADEATSNDTLVKIFSIYTPASTPLSENFESTSFPSPNWGVQNVNGGISWDRSTSAIAAKTGTGSLLINNPNTSNPNNAIDYFISPIVINSSTFDSLFVDFDLAYKPGSTYPGSTFFPLDTLEVLTTTDCGKSFTSIWKKWGENLQTVNDPNYSNISAFTPTQKAEWKPVRIYLTPFVGSSDFQLYFAAKSNRQNNIWLDNINITSQILPQKLKDQGYLIYPNPFNSSFLIHHSAVEPPVDLQSVQLYNSAGQLVWERRYKGNAERQITVDARSLAGGVYILKMLYTNKTIVEKLVKN